MHDLREALDAVAQFTERSFLDLGCLMRTLHCRAETIRAVAAEVFALLEDAGGETALQNLQGLIVRCHHKLQVANERSDKICGLLGDVQLQLEQLEPPVSGLRKVIKTLHSLRVSTRIEAAKGNTGGAAVLARSLDELGKLVQGNVLEICALAEALSLTIQRSLAMESSSRSDAVRSAVTDVEIAMGHLRTLLESRLTAVTWNECLQKRSEQVSNHFGEIVAALQFADITRQRIDHVHNALGYLEQYLRKSASEHDDRSAEGHVEQLLGRICCLQESQLAHASREFVDAAGNLKRHLREIAVSVVAMADDTQKLVCASEHGSEHRSDVILSAMQSIANSLGETDKAHILSGRNLGVVKAGIQDVAERVAEIEFIGEEMQLMAVNAAIGAAHARRSGAGLDVLARNIQMVAEEACLHTQILGRQCISISVHAQSLQDLELNTKGNDVSSLLQEVDERMSHVSAGQKELARLVGLIDRDAELLAREVAEMVQGLSIDDEFLAQLNPVIERLNALGSHVATPFADTSQASLEDLFKELEQCYTMASERRIHETFIKSPQFQAQPAKEIEGDWAAKRRHGLGHNIDLF